MQTPLIKNNIYRITYRVKLGHTQASFISEKVITSTQPPDNLDFKQILIDMLGHWGKIKIDEIIMIDNITPTIENEAD